MTHHEMTMGTTMGHHVNIVEHRWKMKSKHRNL
jgi:hypothetical protein